MAEVLQDELRALQALWAPPAAAAAAAQHGMLPPSPSAALHSLSAGTSSGRTAARPPPDRQQLRSAPAPALPPLVPPPAVAARAAAAADAAPAGSPRPLRVADYQTASTAVLQRQVQLVHHALRACQAACAQAGADVANAQQRISQLEQQICALQQEEAELAEQPLRANRLAHVREWLAERCSTLAAETAALDGKQQVLLKAESQLHATEIEGDLLAEAGASLNTAAAGEAAAQRRRAAGARAREDAAARQALRQAQAQQQQAQQQQAQQAAAAQQAEAERRARAAQQAGAAAQQRLAASQVVIRAREAAAQQAAAAVAERRRQALLLVKQRIDDVRAQIGRKAARCRQLQAQRAEQEAAEFSALAQQGLNPYEVFARRKAEAAAAKAAAQAAAAAQARAAAAAVQLAAEEREHRRLLKQQEAERQVEQRYQQELGRKVQLAKTDAYMRSHTLAGTAILDPTSRLHQHPSDCVAVKPASFGLGRASPQALRLVAARHGGSGDQELQDSCLLPRKYRDMCAGDAAAGSGQSSDAGGTAGDDAGEELDNADGGGGALEPGQHAATNSSSQLGGGGKGLAVAKLSTFEADRMRQAKAAHKARVTQPKAAFGRTFSGDAFIAQPPEVVFRDFLPGSTYSATLRLINRGYTRNSIRLLDVPAEVMHVIELEMPPSGSLAPGASATLRITFTPQAEEDLASSIRLLAESGPLGVPLSCLARRALPSVAPAPLVCLDGRAGGVMLAATARSCLRISNAGALAVDYTVQVTGPLAETTEHSDDQQQEDQQPPSADASTADGAAGGAAPAGSPKPRAAARSLAVAGFRVVRTRGRVPGHGEASIAVEFTPRVPGQVSVPLLVSFAAPEREGLAVPPVELTLKATGRELPVTTLTPVVDFKRVLFGGSYVAPLVLANAGSAAMKAAIVAPPELAEWVAFQPTFGFVQAGETLTVSVSLKPAAAMLDKLARHLLPGGQDVLVVPLHVSVPGQSLPLRVKLRLQPSTGELVLAPSILDFDAVPLSEAAVTALAISNPGRLPQAFSFGARLPQGVSISPGGGYGCVLPGQTLTLQVACRPAIPGPQSFRLACRTLAGRTFMLTGRCKGLAPVVTLSHNAVKFPATAVGDASSASVVLRNSSASEAHAFELAVPVGSHLTVTPAAGVLQPGGSVRLQLDYAPPASLMAAAADGSGDAAAGSTAGAAAGLALQPQREQQQDAAVLPTEPPAAGPPAASSSSWRCYREWVLPCHVRPAQQQDSDTDASADDASSSSSPDIVLHLAVTTCAVAPQLHILSPQLPVPPGKAYAVLDFGPLPVGLRATRALTLANSGPDPAPLSAAPLDPAGVFSVVAALRPLPPGGDGRLLLAFCPQACCEYWEVLTLRSPKSRLRVALKGAGVAPSLSVSPPAAAAAGGGLCFGDVALGDPGPRELKLAVTNTCPFSVSWTTRFIGPGPPAAAAGAAAALPAALPAAAAPAAAPAAAAAAVLAAPAAPAPAATAASPGPPSGWFFCRPSGGVLAAGQSQELTVVFAPGAQQGLLPPGLVGDRLQLLVPHQQQELVVPVSGSAWPDGVYVAGPSYACSSLTGGGSEAAAAAAAADPFAAVLAAAAAAAAAPGTAPAGSTGSSKAKAAGGAGAAAPAAAAGKSGAAAAAAAAAAAGVSCGHVTLPGPVAPGQATSITLEFGAVKPSGGGACPSGELLVEELPAAAREAGWSLDALKVAAPPGERRPLVVRYAAPAKLAAGGPGTLLAAGVPLRQTLRLQCVMRGGWAAGGAAAVADGGRRLTIECSCIVAATAPLLS